MSRPISVLWLWHSYRFSNPFKERMTHLFAANSCGERRHTTLPADPISPALPAASASQPFQELEPRGNNGPGRGDRSGDEVGRPAPGMAPTQLRRFPKDSRGRCSGQQIGWVPIKSPPEREVQSATKIDVPSSLRRENTNPLPCPSASCDRRPCPQPGRAQPALIQKA